MDRLRAALGIVCILMIVLALSENRRAISKRVLFWGLLLQWIVALIVIRVPSGQLVIQKMSDVIVGVLACADDGAKFVFGPELAGPEAKLGFIFAFRVLPTVIFVSALFAVLYHVGIMQWVVGAFAWVMARLMGTSGAESVNLAASLFLGHTEAPLTIRPYLPTLTRSEFLTVMTSGMAHVSGGIMGAYIGLGVDPRFILTSVLMTAPGAILISKMLIPETSEPETLGRVPIETSKQDINILDAASRGTREGLALALNIGAMLIAFIALIALVNSALGLVGTSLQGILGWMLAPVAYMMGVPWSESRLVGGLLGTRVVVNELVAYGELNALLKTLSPRSITIATFALCGFASISSIGIQIGGIGALVPERRHDLASLGVKAMVAGTLANYLTACIAAILL